MPSELIQTISTFTSLVGISLVILGTIWARKYSGRPKVSDYEKWKEKYEKKHGEIKFEDLERGFVDPGVVYDANDYSSHKKFNKEWKLKNKMGYVLGIIGGALVPAGLLLLPYVVELYS